jgi:hypothetical protein
MERGQFGVLYFLKLVEIIFCSYLFTQSGNDGDSMDKWMDAFGDAKLKLRPSLESPLRSSVILPGEFSRSSSFSDSHASSSALPQLARSSSSSSGSFPSLEPTKIEIVSAPPLARSSSNASSKALPLPPARQLPPSPAALSSSASEIAVLSPKQHGGVLMPGLTGSPRALRKVGLKKDAKEPEQQLASETVSMPPRSDSRGISAPSNNL